ncbi:hypothetical protein PENTCL1PPCAC_23613, partial [Pristionchus entomophagus]
LFKILKSFPLVLDIENLADGITLVFVDGKTMYEASHVCKLSIAKLSSAIACIKVFIDFKNSRCTHVYQSS